MFISSIGYHKASSFFIPISRQKQIENHNKKNCYKTKNNYINNFKSTNIYSFKGIKINHYTNNKNHIKISFYGYPVHIVDGGNHATNVAHFAKAIEKNMDIILHDVMVMPQDKNLKNLKSLEKELKNLNNSNKINPGDYIAVPALASVPLLNLKDRCKAIQECTINLTPETVKTHKMTLLHMLKKIYDTPYLYRKEIEYMDPQNQGMEYVYGVIVELNRLKRKGAKVYVPAGHPHDDTIKWLAKKRGLNTELYHYIATGEDKDGKIKKLVNEIKENNWYNFNLLALSEAEIVTVKEKDGIQDYMFAAYDTCITKGARGVYNFSPIYNEYYNKLMGYSYTDTCKIEYPYEEFPANAEVANLAKFVGRRYYKVIADEEETNKFVKLGIDTGKLYKVEDVFTPDEIKKEKINLKGDYVDGSRKLFFRININDRMIFPKCDCEGSGKPSVLPMWGSCFSVFNEIAKDIQLQEKKKEDKYLKEGTIRSYLSCACKMEDEKNFSEAEFYYNEVLKYLKEIKTERFSKDYKIHEFKYFADDKKQYYVTEKLINILEKQKKYKDAKNVLNDIINSKVEQYLYYLNIDIGDEKTKKMRLEIANDYKRIGEYCEKLNEQYPAKICKWASAQIIKDNYACNEILERRKVKNSYIGDLYEQYK